MGILWGILRSLSKVGRSFEGSFVGLLGELLVVGNEVFFEVCLGVYRGLIRGPFGVYGKSVLVDFCIRYDEFNRQVIGKDKVNFISFITDICVLLNKNYNFVSFFSDGTWANSKCFNPEGNITFNQSAAFLKHGLSENLTESPVEQYWK